MSTPSDERVVGRVVKAHGLRGELVVEPRTDNVDARFAPGAVLSVRGSRASGIASLTVVAARRHGDRLLVTVEEVGDRDAAEALDHMNERHNLQHLDIKPRNLFVVSDRVKVADFGLVKHLERTGNSGLLGGVTPLYAPPETFHGKISDKSDQYSLAIVYQELLTGQRPFNGKNARQLAQQHMHEAPDLRALPEPERPILARALSKEPSKRFPNCIAFVRALYSARAPSFANIVIDHDVSRPKSMADLLEGFPFAAGGVQAALDGADESAGNMGMYMGC